MAILNIGVAIAFLLLMLEKDRADANAVLGIFCLWVLLMIICRYYEKTTHKEDLSWVKITCSLGALGTFIVRLLGFYP